MPTPVDDGRWRIREPLVYDDTHGVSLAVLGPALGQPRCMPY